MHESLNNLCQEVKEIMIYGGEKNVKDELQVNGHKQIRSQMLQINFCETGF